MINVSLESNLGAVITVLPPRERESEFPDCGMLHVSPYDWKMKKTQIMINILIGKTERRRRV